jgi:hypothetical protein
MNYKMFNDFGSYKVLETTTEQTVGLFSTELEARKFLRHLNFGGGFDGWTPSFFLRDLSTYINKPRKVKQESV